MLLDFCQTVSGVAESLEVPNVQIVQKTRKGVFSCGTACLLNQSEWPLYILRHLI